MDDFSKMACLVFGFTSSGGHRYPCHWCGILTTLLNAEDFFACEQCQREYIELGYEVMQQKYPLVGKDERNPLFFEEETKRHIARAQHLTNEELSLIVKRGAKWDQDHAQKALRGAILTDEELDFLGHPAEQYINQR